MVFWPRNLPDLGNLRFDNGPKRPVFRSPCLEIVTMTGVCQILRFSFGPRRTHLNPPFQLLNFGLGQFAVGWHFNRFPLYRLNQKALLWLFGYDGRS